MKEHPLSLLRQELAVAEATTRFWKKLTFSAVFFSVLCLGTMVVMVAFGGAYAQELSAYRQRCVDYRSAEHLLKLSSTLVDINDQCFALHVRHARVLEQNFPGVFDTPEGKRLRYMYEVADAKREEVPFLPTSEAVGGGVLPREEPE